MGNALKFGILASAAFAISGCSSTISDLEASADARQEFHVDENYQAVYRRLAIEASCSSGGVGVFASMEGASELYPDLGLGEVSVSMMNMGFKNYYWAATVKKAGHGADVSIVAGNTLISESTAARLERVARGQEAPSCA